MKGGPLAYITIGTMSRGYKKKTFFVFNAAEHEILNPRLINIKTASKSGLLGSDKP